MHCFSNRSFLAAIGAVMLLATQAAWAVDKLKVVATFSILGDMVKNVGGEYIELTTLVGPEGDTHVYEPTPAAARALANADIVIVNGLGFEGWMERLVKASGYKGNVIVASEGISLLRVDANHEDHAEEAHHSEKELHEHHHHHGEFDPHAWQDLANGRLYVMNIASALSEMDPARSDEYLRRAAAYDRQLVALDRDLRHRLEQVPEEARKVITAHDAFQYFGRAYDIDFHAPVGLSTEDEPSAGEIAALVRQMRAEHIRVLFLDNITDPRLVQQLAREADAIVGGKLYPGALSQVEGPAASYLDMFRHNMSQIVDSLMH